MEQFFWIAVAAVTMFSAARVTRLLTYDDFPPIKYLRDRFENATDGTDRGRAWQQIAYCAYCMGFWVTAAVVLWGWAVDWNEPWWLVNGIFGASYAASIIVALDKGEGDD